MSSSSGNSTIIDDVMFDLGGINKKWLPELLKNNEVDMTKVKYLVHSHEHGDHYNAVVERYIYKTYPWITVLVRRHMYERLMKDMRELKRGKPLDTEENLEKRFKVMPDVWQTPRMYIHAFDLPHGDTISTGYIGVDKESGTKFFFATDFESIDALPKAHDIDHIFIEANHQDDFMYKLYDKGVILKDWAIKSSSRHLSIEDAMTYANLVGTKNNKDVHFLHKSSRFFDTENVDVQKLIDGGQATSITDIQ